MIELHIHGGRAVVHDTLLALGKIEGLSTARPGEFTRRYRHTTVCIDNRTNNVYKLIIVLYYISSILIYIYTYQSV